MYMFVWGWNLVSHIQEETYHKAVQEYGAE